MQKPEPAVRPFRFDLTGILLCYTIVFSVAAAAATEQKTISQHGVSITFDTTMFSTVEVIERKARQRDIVYSVPAGVVFGFDFKAFRRHKKTAHNCYIAVTATEDRAVKDFDESYPYSRRLISNFAEDLRRRPKLPHQTIYSPRDVPTTTGEGAGYFFLSKLRYFDFQWGSALGFLGQYSQDDATRYAVGSRLNYKIEGMTHDGKLVVTAYFSVGHPDLPKTKKDEILDEINGKKPTDEEFDKYLRKMEKFLDRKRDDSFRPSLTAIQKLIASVRISNTDPAGWSSQFTGKTIVIQTRETDAKP